MAVGWLALSVGDSSWQASGVKFSSFVIVAPVLLSLVGEWNVNWL